MSTNKLIRKVVSNIDNDIPGFKDQYKRHFKSNYSNNQHGGKRYSQKIMYALNNFFAFMNTFKTNNLSYIPYIDQKVNEVKKVILGLIDTSYLAKMPQQPNMLNQPNIPVQPNMLNQTNNLLPLRSNYGSDCDDKKSQPSIIHPLPSSTSSPSPPPSSTSSPPPSSTSLPLKSSSPSAPPSVNNPKVVNLFNQVSDPTKPPVFNLFNDKSLADTIQLKFKKLF